MTEPTGFLASPRRRRRLAWSGGVLAFLGGLVAFAVLYPSPERPPEVMSDEPAVVLTTPKNVPLTQDVKAATIRTANAFLETAVKREHLERSWDVVHPTLREGYTKDSWISGEIPIVPYPVDSAVYRLDYSHPGLVGWKVSVYPPKGSETRPMTFYLDVMLSGAGDGRRWRVSNWSPASLTVANGAPSAGDDGGSNPFSLASAQDPGEFESRISAAWLLLALVPLGLVIAVVGGKAFRDWRRTAAVERDYTSSSSPS